jgi:outer membrane protein OmpA-like peptidoglycan-associated protein
MGKARLLGAIAILCSLAWFFVREVDRFTRSIRVRQEARRLVAEALADGNPARQAELFQRARQIDPTYCVTPCQRGVQLERRAQFAGAATSFHSCLEGDPEQRYAQLRYARNLLRARGRESYVEVRVALQRFLDGAAVDPVAARDTVARRSAADLVLDLEELLEEKGSHSWGERRPADEILRILLRTPIRGSSRYDGPRVPLRLGFRPNDAILGVAAKEQLQEVAQALRDGSLAGATIRIEGHSDSVEGRTRRARIEISFRRAEVVKSFLVRRCGISADHLAVTGFADDYPVEPNDTEEGRKANRRVELVNLATRDLVRGDVRN